MWWNDLKDIKGWLIDLDNKVDILHGNVENLMEYREGLVTLNRQILDKFEDYMKNVDKLNCMVNEFKGCVAMARGAIAQRKDEEKKVNNPKRKYTSRKKPTPP